MNCKKALVVLVLVGMAFQSISKEGMWVPVLIKDALMNEMKLNGLHLSAQDIYNANASSMKDAVLRFGGGCTSEIISRDGLILTNHHCGYSRIQSHSSLENDYLKDGFWAMSRDEELANPGLEVTRIVRMEDVTEQLLKDYSSGLNRDSIVKANSNLLVDSIEEASEYGAFIRPFYYGNQYIVFITESFTDVRLVGAPPSSIGKFGFDTDNWVWPRHTGDFSLFRIYANTDNKPAEFDSSNVPYKPLHYFPVSLEGIKEGDFTMVYGFPYSTSEYLTAEAVDFIMNVSNPKKIEIRSRKLEVLDQYMASDPLIKIKYASKQSSTSNAWKKWKGQIKGLKRNKALAKKWELESKMKFKLDLYPDSFAEYASILNDLNQANKEMNEVSLARDYYVEVAYLGTDVFRLAHRMFRLESDQEQGKWDTENVNKMLEGHFKDYDKQTDHDVFKAIFPIYFQMEDNFYKPATIKELSNMDGSKQDKWLKEVYEKSILTDQNALHKALYKGPDYFLKQLAKDELYEFAKDLYAAYRSQIAPTYSNLSAQLDELQRHYMNALMYVFPEEVYYPDANGTLRLTYGKIEGMSPSDAVEYQASTTTDGILQKYIPADREYDLPEKLVSLLESKDFGRYGENGELKVCFIASNHTSGGNSGSPVINGKGELIGLNFDRNWEGTMSDIMYDINQCRNISVDIRYVLFIVDKFAGAGYLLDEMKLVESKKELTK